MSRLWDKLFPNNDLAAARALVQQKKLKEEIATLKITLDKLRAEEKTITDANHKLIKRIEISDISETIKHKETELEIAQMVSGSLPPPAPSQLAPLTDSDFVPTVGGGEDADLAAALAASLADDTSHPLPRKPAAPHQPPMYVPKQHRTPPVAPHTPERHRNNPSDREMRELEEARLRSLLQNQSPVYSPNALENSLEADLRRISEMESGGISSPSVHKPAPAPAAGRKDSLSPEEIEQLAALAENDEMRRLRESQDRAYQESLEADRAREREEKQKRDEAARKLREEQQQKEADERRAAEAEAAAKAHLLQRKNRIEFLKSSIAPEPPQQQKEGVTLLKIRLPTGETATRKFPTSAKLDSVMDLVELKQLEADEAANAPIRESKRSSWQLVLSFPQRVFAAEDLQKTLADLKLINTALFVKET